MYLYNKSHFVFFFLFFVVRHKFSYIYYNFCKLVYNVKPFANQGSAEITHSICSFVTHTEKRIHTQEK